MVELKKNYQIGKRRFGKINWLGSYTLYKKESLRFLIVFGQTVLGPVVTALLFLLVISLAIGPNKANVLGVSFIEFLAPGLIAMQVVQQSFSHTSSSILIGKMMGNIVDIVGSPLSAIEITTSLILAATTRALTISILSIIIFSFFIEIKILSYFHFFIYLFLTSFILGSSGLIAGLWAEKFDHMSTVTNFFIVPLSFLSGTFYSIERLPDFLQKLSFYNPFFHMIDGFRFAFIMQNDGQISFGLIYLFILFILSWFFAWFLWNKGYKIKS
tara:strand:+ start:1055 stop:1867 length:813 start_codon:yes stop_codon:yes gene_type:complete